MAKVVKLQENVSARHRYALFYKSKVFFLLYASLLQRFKLLLVVKLQPTSQRLFSLKKHGDDAQNSRDIA